MDWLTDDLLKGMLDGILDWLAKTAVATLTGLLDLLRSTAFTNPDVTELPQVAAVSGQSLIVVNTCYVLAITVAGFTVMTRETLQVRYGVQELAPRLLVGFIGANFATPLCREIITLANALTRALTGDDLRGEAAFGQMRAHIVGATARPENALLAVILVLFIAGLAVMLLITWIVRIAVLIVLVGIAPVALACHGLPFTDPAAKLWWRSLLGCLAVPMLQAIVLFTALKVLLTPSANLTTLGLPGLGDPNSIMNLFVVLCLLWTVVKIPGLVRRFASRGGGGQNIAAYLLRVAVVQQLTRGLGKALRRRAGSARQLTSGHGAANAAANGNSGGRLTWPRPIRRAGRPQPATAATSRPASRRAVGAAPLARFSDAPTTNPPLSAAAGDAKAPTFTDTPTPAAPRRAARGSTPAAARFTDQQLEQPRPALKTAAEHAQFSATPQTAAVRRRTAAASAPPPPAQFSADPRPAARAWPTAAAAAPTTPATFSAPPRPQTAPARPPAPVSIVFSHPRRPTAPVPPRPAVRPSARRSDPS